MHFANQVEAFVTNNKQTLLRMSVRSIYMFVLYISYS